MHAKANSKYLCSLNNTLTHRHTANINSLLKPLFLKTNEVHRRVLLCFPCGETAGENNYTLKDLTLPILIAVWAATYMLFFPGHWMLLTVKLKLWILSVFIRSCQFWFGSKVAFVSLQDCLAPPLGHGSTLFWSSERAQRLILDLWSIKNIVFSAFMFKYYMFQISVNW